MDVSINTSLDKLRPEVLFVATPNSYRLLSECVSQLNGRVDISLQKFDETFYPISLNNCVIILQGETNGLLDINIIDKEFFIKGDKKALDHLSYYFSFMADSALNFHWHIDYYEGNQDVLETNISLVLQVV